MPAPGGAGGRGSTRRPGEGLLDLPRRRVQEQEAKARRVPHRRRPALAITRRLAGEHPRGILFRNTDGAPWSHSALKSRFTRLRLAIGRKRLDEAGLTPPELKRLTAAQRADESVRAAHAQAVLDRRREIAMLAVRITPRYSLYTLRHS